MSRSRHRRRPAIVTRAPQHRPLPTRKFHLRNIASAIVVVMGLIASVSAVLPRVTVEASEPAAPANPFTSTFKISNNQFYPLEDVGIEASLWCVTLGRSPAKPAPIPDCIRSTRTSRHEWKKHRLEADESYGISLEELYWVTPGALRYAEVSVVVSYRPWFVPAHREKEIRFAVRQKDNGDMYWVPKPLE
jgi:hypothetical protein